MAAAMVCDIPKWRELPNYVASQEVNRVLGQRGFCLIQGFVDVKVKHLADREAHDLRRAGALQRTPREACAVLLGEATSYWTLPLEEAPEAKVENLQQIALGLQEVGEAVSAASAMSFGEVIGWQPGLLHYARLPEDRALPRILNPEEADYWSSQAVKKKVILLHYLGPSPATLTLTLREDPTRVYRVTSRGGNFIVAYRNDTCALALDAQGEGATVQVDFFIRSRQALQQAPCDRLPMPRVLQDWYLERMEAIVDNDMFETEDIPLHFVRDAVTTFFKKMPIRIVQLSHELPSLPHFGGHIAPFEASLLGGQDVVTEICRPRRFKVSLEAYGETSGDLYSWGGKWDPDEYYDTDPSKANDFKMYTRHLSVLNRGCEAAGDHNMRDFGIVNLESFTMDRRARMLAEAHFECLASANFDQHDLKHSDVGIFSGLCGENQTYHFMCQETKINHMAAINMSNAAMVNRLSYALNCRGPCMAVDTGDASGSAALDTAVHSLREGRSGPISLASGCQWISNPFELIIQCAAGVISRSGRTRVFEESSDGFVKGEGVVTVLLEPHDAPKRTEKRKAEPVGIRALVLGSGVNAKGMSATLSAPSGPALTDVVMRAARDAHVPAAILEAVEVSAGATAVADTIEWGTLALMLRTSDRSFEQTCVLRSGKATYGNLGPVNGLVSVARACKLIEVGMHGPTLHLRQMIDVSAFDDDNERFGGRLQVLTEAIEAHRHSQVVGVSSFGFTGTNCHHVLFGSKPEDKRQPNKAKPVSWWPGGAQKEVHPPRRGYFIVGTWSAWKRPCKMEEEAEGVYGYTLTMGENRWETFQIWLDEDRKRVLHPAEPSSMQEAQVLGPDGDVPRELCWRIVGHSNVVRLVNEQQQQQLELLCAERDEEGYRCQLAYPGNSLPPGHENAESVLDMPLVELNRSFLGVPGDRYRIRLHVRGHYRRVEWSRVGSAAAEPPSQEPAFAHKYKIVGDHSFWAFEEMQPDAGEAGLYRATVRLLKAHSHFQIYRDGDWEQGFYPKVAGAGPEAKIVGPDGQGHGRHWQIRGSVGDVFGIEFRRFVAGDLDERSVSWELQGSGEVDFAELAKSHRYYFVGSSTGFERLEEMEHDEATGGFSHTIVIGPSGLESFQLLLNASWLAVVHPSVKDASTYDEEGHTLEGPDDAGDGMYWTVGSHPSDQVTPGDHVLIHLELEGGLPKRVRWEKRRRADAPCEYIAWGSNRVFSGRSRGVGYPPFETEDGPARLVTRRPFMDLETIRGELPRLDDDGSPV